MLAASRLQKTNKYSDKLKMNNVSFISCNNV